MDAKHANLPAMRELRFICAAWLAGATVLLGIARGTDISPGGTFFGCCDGSAVVALDEMHFVTASDEDSTLRIYNRSHTNAPVWQHDFAEFLQLTAKAPESDLEGAARIGDVIYWISSHSRNSDGKERPNRQRLFATRIAKTTNGFALEPVGKPYRGLLAALLTEPKLSQFKLGDAARLSPEERGGLNIEGLAATAHGGLLVAFRNPLPENKALLVAIENPDDIMEGKPPRFSEPLLLDLGGRGVRDIALVGDRYFILAGGAASKGKFDLFEWRGPGTSAVASNFNFGKFAPEGLSSMEGHPQTLLCTLDDSSLRVEEGCDCKDLKDSARRRFRVVTLRP